MTRLSKKTILLNMRLESKGWGEKYADMFCSEVPVEVQRALLHGLFRNYSDASEHCYTVFRHPIARNASGPYRHSKIEEDWCGIAERFPTAVKFTHKPFRNKKSGKITGTYVQLEIGRVRLTESCVRTPSSLPRDADFRETLAMEAQRSLFGEDEKESDGYLYGVYLHGVDVASENRNRPAFAKVRFPNRRFSGYIGKGVDLWTRFADIVGQFIDVKNDFTKPAPVKPRTPVKEEQA